VPPLSPLLKVRGQCPRHAPPFRRPCVHPLLIGVAYIRRFLNCTVVFLVLVWRPLWPCALGSRPIRLMVAPALILRVRAAADKNFNLRSTLVAYTREEWL